MNEIEDVVRRLLRNFVETQFKGKSRSHNRKIHREIAKQRYANVWLYGTSHPEKVK